MREPKDPALGPVGSWSHAGRHSWSTVDPEPLWSNLKWGEGDSPSLQGPGNGLTCGSQGHWGPRCEKPLVFDAGSFWRTSNCSRHVEVASFAACPRGCCTPYTSLPRAPGLLQVGDSKPLFTASVRSPHRRPPSEQAKIRHYSQLPVPARVQTGSLVFPLVSTTAFISLFLFWPPGCLVEWFLRVKVWGVSGPGGPSGRRVDQSLLTWESLG